MTNYYIGQVVRNLGEILSVVVAIDETNGDLVLRHLWNDGFTWRANPANCEPCGEPAASLRHRDGLMSLG